MRWKSCLKLMALLAILSLALALAEADEAGKHVATNANVRLTVLYNFGTESDLIYPAGPIVAQGRDGSFYTNTVYGGTYNDGVVFKIAPNGTPTVIGELNTNYGATGLSLGADGNFYGTTSYGGLAGGYGTIFKVSANGKMTTLYEFSGQGEDGYPMAPPIQANDGNFYGTARGDLNGNGAEVYKMTPAGVEKPLFTFVRKQGAAPADPLLQATDGNFYGTTGGGGASGRCGDYGCGTVFRVTPNGTFTQLHSFLVKDFDGYYPYAPVTEGSDGNLYGTVTRGGQYGYGIVYRINRTGNKYTILHSFNITDGEAPFTGLVQATDGNLYGTTMGGGASNVGTIFRITSGGQFSVIYSFDPTTGKYPSAGLLQNTNGKLYGFAGEGGTYNYGTFFSVDINAQPFVSLVTSAGKVGKSVGTLGQGFTGTTSVSFHGKAAKFNVKSDTFLTAIVPNRATTGYVTVTTPNGDLKSNRRFRVIPK